MLAVAPQTRKITPADAAQEYLDRQAARKSLAAFATYTNPRYVLEPAHELIADALQAVVEDQLDRLMIFAPPQSGKSELSSRRLPAYWLGTRPNDPVMMASYSGAHAKRLGGAARDILTGQRYKNIFPGIEIDQFNRAKDYWKLQLYQGQFVAGGFLGPLTGEGAVLGIVDDPIANWAAAQSITIRETTYQWYKGTYLTRMWKNGKIVIVMTRWHEDDLAGRLLKEDDWHVIRIPAIAETQQDRDFYAKRAGIEPETEDPLGRAPGETILPFRMPIEFLTRIKNTQTTAVWNSEYQGRPTAPEGNRIKREWLENYVDFVPRNLKRVRYWDKAGTEGGGAYTVGLLMAYNPATGETYIEDMIRGQWEAGTRETQIKLTAERDAKQFNSRGAVVIWLEQEPGSGGKESAQNTLNNLKGYAAHKESPATNKDERLEPFVAACEHRKVYIKRAAWNEECIGELTAIPYSAYRDIGDCCSGAYNKLAIPTQEQPQQHPHDLYDKKPDDRATPADKRIIRPGRSKNNGKRIVPR